MKPGYTIKHWLLTIIISPFIAIVVVIIRGKDSNDVLFPLQAIWGLWIFGVLFSAPAFLIYFCLFFLLEKFSLTTITRKAIIITVAVLSVIFSFLQFGINNDTLQPLKIAYIVTAIITGSLLKLEKSAAIIPKNIPESEN